MAGERNPREETSRRRAYRFLGLALALVPVLATLSDPWRPFSPNPIPFVLVRLIGSLAGYLLFLTLPVGFWLLLEGTDDMDAVVERRSLVVFGLATFFSWFGFLAQFQDAIRDVGVGPVLVVGIVNTAVPVGLAIAYFRNRTRPSWWITFALHWILFAWIGSYAFAWTDRSL